MTKYEGVVVENPEDQDELMVQFPKELVTLLEWQEGDMLRWSIEDDEVIIEKKG